MVLCYVGIDWLAEQWWVSGELVGQGVPPVILGCGERRASSLGLAETNHKAQTIHHTGHGAAPKQPCCIVFWPSLLHASRAPSVMSEP